MGAAMPTKVSNTVNGYGMGQPCGSNGANSCRNTPAGGGPADDGASGAKQQKTESGHQHAEHTPHAHTKGREDGSNSCYK